MLGATDGELALEGGCPTWTILGADGAAYYRAAVDPAVATQLLTPGSAIAKVAKPSTAEKLLLVHNLRAAVDRDEVGIDKSLALTPLIARDADDKVARAALVASDLPTNGLDDALYARFIRYFLATYRPLAMKLGWKRQPKDSDDRQELRKNVMGGVAYHDPALAKEATKLATAWLANRTSVDDDMVPGVLRAAAHRGDAALFDKILAAAKQPRDRNEQQRLLGALGAFTDPVLVNRALALVTSGEFDLRDALSIGYGFLYNRETRGIAIAFVETHLDEMLKHMREDESGWLLEALSTAACDQATVDRLSALVTPRAKTIGGAEAASQRGFELSRQCIANTQRMLPALTAYLK
jgi:hypothetical protein